jgi:hypothetical protein
LPARRSVIARTFATTFAAPRPLTTATTFASTLAACAVASGGGTNSGSNLCFAAHPTKETGLGFLEDLELGVFACHAELIECQRRRIFHGRSRDRYPFHVMCSL